MPEVPIEKLDGPDALLLAYEAQGLTAAYQARKDKELIEKKKTIFQKLTGKALFKGLSLRFDNNAKIIAQTAKETLLAITVDDNAIQLGAARMIHDMKGDRPAEKHDILVETLEDRLRRLDKEDEAKNS